MGRCAFVLAATVLAALALGTVARSGAAVSRTYYTAAQAATGAESYARSCSQCHGAKLEGGSAPALKGPRLHGYQAIADFYTYIVRQMPAQAPASLSTDTYLAICAFLLAQNGHRPGKNALTAASARKIAEKM